MSNSRPEKVRKELSKNNNKEKLSRNIFAIAMTLIVVAIIGGAAWYVQANKVEAEKERVEPAGLTDDFGLVFKAEDFGGETSSDAKEVVIYEDLQCPACQQFEETTGPILTELVEDGDIVLEYRFVSFLDEIGGSQNEYSERAASALFCMNDTGNKDAVLEYHKRLYAEQPQEGTAGPTSSSLYNTAESIESSVDRNCIIGGKYAPWMDVADTAFANAEDVTGTPTVFVDGEKVETNALLAEIS